jgi:hypothetical protein
MTGDQYLDIVEAVDGPGPEWYTEAARAFDDLPADTAGARKAGHVCPGCGRWMGGRVPGSGPVHFIMPDLELACSTPDPEARSSSVPGEVTCTQCVIAILKVELSK